MRRDGDAGRLGEVALVDNDFMIGGADVDVTGGTRDGHRLPLLMGGSSEL